MDAPEKHRWNYPTPGWLVLGSLAVTGLLWLSNWLELPAWHKGYAVLAAVAGVGVVLVVLGLWWLVALVFRWRFQFGIRTLLMLTVAVALPCSWLAVEMKKAREQATAAAVLGVDAVYDWPQATISGNTLSFAACPTPLWLQKIMGKDFFMTVVEATISNDDGLQVVHEFAGLKVLNITETKVTDGGLEKLVGLRQLSTLNFAGTWHGNPVGSNCAWQITDAGIKHLQGLTNLRELNLGGTQVSDVGVKYLKALTQLEALGLGCTFVTDAGIECLRELRELQALDLGCTKVTDAGAANLKDLPLLQELNLSHTQITDAGLSPLKGCSQLQRLFLVDTRVTDVGLEELGRLPQLKEIHVNHMLGGANSNAGLGWLFGTD